MIDIERRSYMVAQLRMKVGLICDEQDSTACWLLAAKLESSHNQNRVNHVMKVTPVLPHVTCVLSSQKSGLITSEQFHLHSR